MKSLKMSGLTRLLSFLLIAVILISVVSIAVGGRQSTNENEAQDDELKNENVDNNDENNENNVNNEQESASTENETNKEEQIKYYNKLTGLEVSELQANTTPIGFLVDSLAPLYGISKADITFEIPIENGRTRLLAYHTNTTSLWKIGSLAPTRDFISSISNLFSAPIVSYGNDDILKYDSQNYTDKIIDIKPHSDTHYIENAKYIYSSIDRINALIESNGITVNTQYSTSPFLFADNGSNGTISAETIITPYSDSNTTTLKYNKESGSYVLYKNSSKTLDKLFGADLTYKNVFVLFASSTTYENTEGKEQIIDTICGGSGYYASNGSASEIKWSVNEEGALVFKTLSGDILNVSRGNSYILYYKSSVSSDVILK